MIRSRITANWQTTVWLAVRHAFDIKPGDTLGYRIEGDMVVLHRVEFA